MFRSTNRNRGANSNSDGRMSALNEELTLLIYILELSLDNVNKNLS